MCNERYSRRRRDADESRAIWEDFEQTQRPDDLEPPVEATEPEPAEVREAIATPER